MTPFRATPQYDWQNLLSLIQSEFAYMDGRIDPPSSMHRLTAEDIAQLAKSGEVWLIEDATTVVACIFLTPRSDVLYIGKLAVRDSYRGRGLARKLILTATARARQRGLHHLELQTRVELFENHNAFARLGFNETARTSHEGFRRPTSITMRRAV